MISSAITIYENTSTVTNNNQQSIPIQSYNAYGESVSFTGNQPVISFSSNPLSTHYPVSWQILSVNTGGIHNTNSATPFISTNNTPLSLNHFTHYTTSRINDTTQNSAQLIQYSNTTQSASVFFFHHYTMSASLAWKNKHPYNQTYMIDFTLITPYTNIYHVGGNSFHKMIMNNTGFIPASCVNLQVGGIDINWCSDISLFHGGMIEQKDHHDIVVIPFGTVTLQSNETYTIDPSMEPTTMHNALSPGAGGNCFGCCGGGGRPCVRPPVICFCAEPHPDKCIENGTSNDQMMFKYQILSPIEPGTSVILRFCEIQKNTNYPVVLGCSYVGVSDREIVTSFNANYPGCYQGFRVDYYAIDTGKWCISHSFCGSDYSYNEYINTATGYAFPSANNGSQGYIIKDNGKVLGSIIGGVQPLGPLVVGSPETIQMYEAFFSKCGYYVPQARGWSLTFVKQSDSSVYSCCTQFASDQYRHEIDENQNGFMKSFISLGLTAASIVLGLISDGTYTLIAAALGLAAWEVSSDTCTLTSGITLEQNEVSCKESGAYFTCGGNAKACGMGTLENPYYYFGEHVGAKFCAQGYPANTSLRNPYCTIAKYNFGEQFMVFNKTQSCNPTFYSGSASSSAYIHIADE